MPRRLAATLVVCLCLIPAGLRGQAPELNKPYFDSEGVKIHYVILGKEDGEPVLLIHGFTASIDTNWGPVLKGLTKDYKVIAMDCRGYGGSEKPHDPKKYGLEMTRDAVRLLDHLKIQKAHVVGYSMGASITLQIATRYPERVRTATLGGNGLPLPGRQKFMKALADSLEQGKGFEPLIAALTPKGQPRPSQEQITAINERLTARNDIKALAAVIRGSINDKDLELYKTTPKSAERFVVSRSKQAQLTWSMGRFTTETQRRQGRSRASVVPWWC